ncbi:sugar ABC transporter substrate-binding protein [Pseudovibrio sp. Tun.PSC04-5.I4]|uniref:sugar ABC transporter substrate-binding protein n=1 Tax=Pseudovibrio sp. Tun.PSC04-5.I4 TaxID=1798213 RepID=UPI000884D299|nr:sugar ABC transporter substrate-binding protein [Pseudovibrio sp. Tun.PSC04-5.I4]SDR47778.1 ABC-type sugar transport system, substrate-binding protein, contains N-terminal xre family HTH domain [Pseudovibrio sp. Tun.PSC04-5.I4]
MKTFIVSMAAALTIVASPVSAADGQVVLGKIPFTLEHSYHQSIVKIFSEYAEEKYGAKTIIVDGQASSESALSAVENLIAQKVDGIALHSPDIGMTATAVAAAQKAGIPIVTTLIYPKTKSAPHIQPKEEVSSFRMGEVAAEQWLKAFPSKLPKVAILNFGGFEQIAVLRTEPFFKGVQSVAPEAELVAMQNGFGSTIKSMEVTLDILQANPEVNIIFGANDDMALGALAATEQLGRGRMDDGKPLTEIIAGVDAGENAMVKIFNPKSSFKLSHGQVRDNGLAEVDTLMGMIEGKIAKDEWAKIDTDSPEFDYWNSTVEDAQTFLEENFSFEKDLKAMVAKQR